MTDHQDQPLRPADFSPHTPAPESTKPSGRQPSSPWFWSSLAGGALLILFVFLLLPSLVAPPSEEAHTTANTSVAQTSGKPSVSPASSAKTNGATEASSERSPFAEAQLQKQRRAAQEALQKALELQEILSELSVGDWAPEEYAAAIALAETGDNAYRERDFIGAAGAYQKAGDALVAIETSIPGRADEAVTAATLAIESGDATAANTPLIRLQQLSPGDVRIAPLQQRIAVIPEVSRAIASATEAASADDYSSAVSAIQQALSMDPTHQKASALLTEYRQLDADARFRKAMSEGYLALEEFSFDAAGAAFTQAAKIRPGAPEPQAAQAELSAARTAATLRSLQTRGRQQEQAEQWSEAVETYQEALSIDAAVLFAQEGLARAEPRAALAKALTDILENTDRLVDPRALKGAETTLTTARATLHANPPDSSNTNPVLDQQINNVAKALDYASKPVQVAMVSDGVTDVTLLRVKRLGSFSDTTLTLRPGHYTAMGVRNGFRDVRVNFDVVPGKTPVIDVRCTEAI